MSNNKILSYKAKIFLIFLLIFFLTTGPSCGQDSKIIASRIELEMWTVFDSQSDFQPLIETYQQAYPNISVQVKKFRIEEYENELLNALAEDRGPDIFMIHNTWLRDYLPKLEPLPEETTLPRVVTTGKIKKDIVIKEETTRSITPLEIRQKFVDVIAEDVIIDNKIYGLPLYLDTMILFYNRDLLNNAGFAQPPKHWDQFQSMSNQLTKINLQDELIQSGAALGTSHNIENAADILALLMMQTGAEMTNAKKTASTFHLSINEDGATHNPGVDALRFYTSFARQPPTTAYSWNEKQANNLEAFTSGKLAFFLGYTYHLPLIKSQTLGKLNFSMAPMVQIQNTAPVNMANYWLPVVSKKAGDKNAAWNFIQFSASPDNVTKYLSVVKKPTALRELIDQEKNDESLFASAGQALTAQSWYYGKKHAVMKKTFEEMIDQALVDDPDQELEQQLQEILNNAVAVINQTYRQ